MFLEQCRLGFPTVVILRAQTRCAYTLAVARRYRK